MSKKSVLAFVVFLVLGVVVTYGMAFIDFALNISKGPVGLPLGFSYFNFLGSSTDQRALLMDIAFWFAIIWLIWRIISYFSGRVKQ